MIYRLTGLTIVVALALAPKLSAQEVNSRNGNVYFRNSVGREVALTTSGRDLSPSLSSDGSEVIFRREVRAATFDDDGVYELWTAEIATKQEHPLIKTTEVGREFAPFGTPEFSADGKVVYFLVREAQTSLKIMRLNRKTGAIDLFVSGATEFRVVRHGKYEGYLVACLRQEDFDGKSFHPVYWYYLIDSNGREAGFVGKEKSDMDRFFKTLGN